MNKVLLGLLVIGAAMPVSAQVVTPAGTGGLVSAGPTGTEFVGASSLRAGGNPLRGSLETPTMRRQKLAQAIALRDEALALQAKDGGTLSAQHVREIQRKSRAILAYSGSRAGSLVPIAD